MKLRRRICLAIAIALCVTMTGVGTGCMQGSLFGPDCFGPGTTCGQDSDCCSGSCTGVHPRCQ